MSDHTAYWQNQNAIAQANMTPEERAAYQEQLQQQRRTGSLISGAAGFADIFQGRRDQRLAEGDIDTMGAEADAIKEQMRNLKMPGAMDPESVAAAIRNATILGAGKPQEDSSQLAAAKMAMEAGADATKVQRALTEAEAQKDLRARDEQQEAFKEGLGYAQEDALREHQQEMDILDMDYYETQRALQMAQQQSLMGQQQKQAGARNLVGAGTNWLQSGGLQQIGGLFGGEGGGNFSGENYLQAGAEGAGGATDVGGLLENLGDFDFGSFGGADGMRVPYEEGGIVQKTPGVFKHDDGDGIYEEGENEMILMAQKAGGLVDTGIRQTGGEFVLNPKQAKGMEKAYERIKRKKDPSRQDLLALYEAVRFLDEPQFD